MDNRSRAIADFFKTASLGAPENAIGFVLWRVVHRYQREIDDALAAVDLTHLQFTILALTAWLARIGDPVCQADIARFGDIQAMQVSHMLKALEGKGMVTRRTDASDIRAKRIEVTSAGLAALRSGMPRAIEVQERLFGAAGRPGGSLLKALLAIDHGAA